MSPNELQSDRPSLPSAPGAPGWSQIGLKPLIIAALLLLTLVWSYWPILVSMVRDWQYDDNYSIGQLVPLAALWLLWNHRKQVWKYPVAPSGWGGLLIIAAQAVRAYGLIFLYDSAQRYSLVLTIAGVVLLVAGRKIFYQVRWILAFLLLMVPLPGRIHNLINAPLQTLATSGAVFFLELLGVGVARNGNVLSLTFGEELAVAEACSGLRMLMAFIVVSAVFAGLFDRPRWQRVILVVSSVPIAIACNLIRLVVTAELYLHAGSETAERFFHDFAGLTMMPLAVVILLGELILLDKLIISDLPEKN